MFDVVFVLVGEIFVVLGLGWLGILLYEVIGYGLEGDFNQKGMLVFVKLMGKYVVSDICTIVDDGMILGWWGSLNVDDEGILIQRIILIQDGVLVGYLQDWMNVCLMDCKFMGNGC